MSDTCWLSIIGLGEDGLNGLTPASRSVLETSEIIMGPPRHLALIGKTGQEQISWPVPFADGVPVLMGLRGRSVAVLASGDPFWFGAGSVITRDLNPHEWRAFPGPSTAALACAWLGWQLETTHAFGLHARPFETLRPHLAQGARVIALLRDGDAPVALAAYLKDAGFGESVLHVCEALGGPRAQIRNVRADRFDLQDITHPVCVAIDLRGGPALPLVPGREDGWFTHDGQITKSPVRALTLAALAPRAGEHLWDIGAGSGSIGIEWLLAHPTCTATGIERDATRAAWAKSNAAKLAAGRFDLRVGEARDLIGDLPRPDAVFVGGGLRADLLKALWQLMPESCRMVANGVTLETESLLAQAQATYGGTLTRIEIAQAQPLGRLRGWKSSYPIVQWSVTR